VIELNFKMPLAQQVVQLLVLFLCAGASFCSASHAQERCSVEVKLLLSPEQTQRARSTLDFDNEVAGLVYFFDTDSLDLFAKGLILRLRRGADSDLTIKLRPPKGKTFFATSADDEGYKCEEDFTGDGPILSYSIKRKCTTAQLPATGGDISRLLSQKQKKLLEEANVPIDWLLVKRIVEIKSTTWESRIRKLTLEAWEWPDGKLLEISTRVRSGDGPRTYAELQKLAKSNGLSLSPAQGFKTSIVLESVTHAKAK
jgi:hypothetical protein